VARIGGVERVVDGVSTDILDQIGRQQISQQLLEDGSAFVTTRQLADLVGVQVETICRAIRKGRIKTVRWGGRHQIPKAEAERVLEEGYY
jgi:excisionase family DNA binding protein